MEAQVTLSLDRARVYRGLADLFRTPNADSTRRARAWFELLKRAYVEARYSEHYKISEEQLAWLGDCALKLHGLVERACRKRLANLVKAAESGGKR